MRSRRVNAFTSLLSVYWQRAGIFDRAIISVLNNAVMARKKIFLKTYIILTSITLKLWMLKFTALNVFCPKGVWIKYGKPSSLVLSTSKMPCCESNKNGACFYETVMQEKYNISYPKPLKLIRRINTLSPPEEKTAPPPTLKPNFTLHMCTNWHMVFNFYVEINPKDNDHF